MPPEASSGAPGALELRRAEDDDAAAVAEVYLASRASAQMPAGVHPEDEVRAWVAGRVRDAETWVALAGDAVAGFVTLAEDWLDDLYVAPAHQRQGVGAALLDLAKSVRPDGFALWVFEQNHRARDFYAAHGLVALEHTDGSANEERAPDVRMAWPGHDPLGFLRRHIDVVDDELALLLARRTALTAAVQDTKDVGGSAGRDPDREAAIVDRMLAHAPGLDRDLVATVMHTLIAESLAAWERSAGQRATDG